MTVNAEKLTGELVIRESREARARMLRELARLLAALRRGAHIDHIRPCASFDLTDPEQQRACFHYMNLQPLWEKDNLKKGARFGIAS